MRPAFVIAVKDLRLMLRDRPGMMFTILFPLLFGLFFGAIYADSAEGEQAPIRLIVIDDTEGESRWAADLKQRIEGTGRVALLPGTALADAQEALRSGQAAVLLELPPAFDQWFESIGAVRSGSPRLTLAAGRMGEPEIVRGVVSAGLYEMLIDSLSDAQASQRRRDALMELAADPQTARQEAIRVAAAASALQALASDGGGNAIAYEPQVLQLPPVGLASPPNSFSITFPQAIMWAVLGCAASFAVGLVNERNAGTLVRLRTTPISAIQILGGKGLACMAVAFALSLVFVVVGRLFFDVRPVSYPTLLAALLAVSFAFSGIMMLLAVLGRSKTSPGQLAWGVILIMAITGGGMLPLVFMPEWLVAVSHFSPVKWGILVIEAGVWRGLGPAEMILPLGVLAMVGVAGFVTGARAFVMSERISGV
jgi:ABC-2 type transport system permease protein